MLRIRHCVECPHCLTRYLISFSPYRNGSYLIPTVEGSFEEYVLYCSCKRSSVAVVCRRNEVKICEVSTKAYDRGYGTPEEIVSTDRRTQDAWPFDVSRYFNNLKSIAKRRNPR